MSFLSQARAKGTFIVMGAGSVILRKGVDLFIAAAAGVQRLGLDRSVQFVWVGGGYCPEEDLGYSIYLKEQLERSGLEEHVTLMEEVADLEPLYGLADVLLLTSRLDPLPNVAIDAAYRGIPIVCFKDASGMADLLLADGDTAIGVVPYLDIDAAIHLIAKVTSDESQRMRMAHATVRLARTIFDMERYVQRLDALGTESSAWTAQQRADRTNRRALPSIWFDRTWYAAQNGNTATYDYDHFIRQGAEQGCLPSALVEHIMQSFGSGTSFSLQIYDLLVEASANWPSEVPLSSLWLLTSLFVPEWHGRGITPLEGFIAYLRDELVTDKPPGPLFDLAMYRRLASETHLLPLGPDESAMIHWLLHGQAARIVPTDRFDELYYRSSNPDVDSLPIWGFAHFIQHGVHEGRLPRQQYTFCRSCGASPQSPKSMPMLYHYWHRLDFPNELQGLGNDIPAAYERRLDELLRSDQLARIFAAAQAIDPAVGDMTALTEILLPPFHGTMTSLHAEVRRRLPAAHYDSIVCVPWICTGGADLVAGVLARALLRVRPGERVLILRTDQPHFERANWLPAEADCVDVSDLMTSVPPALAENLLRIVFRGLTARRVFNVNSRLCWATFRTYGTNLAATLQTYAYMFCWDHAESGLRVGYPAEFFAGTAGSMTAFLTDTAYLRNELTKMYQLPATVRDRIVPMLTPAQTQMRTPSIARQVLDRAAPGEPTNGALGRTVGSAEAVQSGARDSLAHVGRRVPLLGRAGTRLRRPSWRRCPQMSPCRIASTISTTCRLRTLAFGCSLVYGRECRLQSSNWRSAGCRWWQAPWAASQSSSNPILAGWYLPRPNPMTTWRHCEAHFPRPRTRYAVLKRCNAEWPAFIPRRCMMPH